MFNLSGRIKPVTEYILALMLIFLPAFLFSRLPEFVAVHFNLYGEQDGYGNRWLLLIIPVTGLFLYIFLYWSEKLKKYFNYPVKITQENRQLHEELVFELIYQYKIITLIVFNLLTVYSFFFASTGHVAGLGLAVSLIFMAYLLPIPLYLLNAYKLK